MHCPRFTAGIARRVALALESSIGCRPDVLFSEVHRSRVDLDRHRRIATAGELRNRYVWFYYKRKIEDIRAGYATRGLLVDIQGHVRRQ